MITSLNPATGEVVRHFDAHDDAQVEAALARADQAQRAWRRRPLAERVQVLTAAAGLLRERKARYAALITLEMGKPIAEAEAEVEKCALNCDHYAAEAVRYLGDEPVPSNAAQSKLVFDPLGLVLAVMPWNYPFWQVVRFAAPALAAGNGAVLKHANNVPQCALALEEVFRDAGAPAGLFTTLLVEASKVKSLIEDPRIAAVTLTGSTPVGKLVAAQAGAVLKKQVLELGGSDPFIVLADADLDTAAKVAAKARFQNAGQSCICAKRFIVEASVADRFAELLCAHVRAIRVGDPTQRDTTMGPMARHNLRAELHAQVVRTVEQGGRLLLGGHEIDGPGAYYAPTVFDHVTPEMAVGAEETFGPVAAILRVPDADAAVALANATEYGLGAGLWTTDLVRAERLVREIDAGAVFVNGLVASDPRLPFGGIKQSGYGRELGREGIREFTNVKTVWIGPAQAPTADTRSPAVLRPAEIKTHDRGGGASTTPLVGPSIGATAFINGITSFGPGAAIPFHSHNCEESVMLLEGHAMLDINGEEIPLGPLDTTWIPPDVSHRFRNLSATEPMKIFWTYARLDATRTLTDSGATNFVSAEHGKTARA